MNVGLPGSGIGGIFYLLAALSAPVRSGNMASFRNAIRHAGMALAIVLALGITGWLLGLIVIHTPISAWASQVTTDARHVPSVLRAASIAATLGTLALVMIAVWIAAFVVHGPAAFRRTPSPQLLDRVAPLARASSDR